jgi:hypothetical protein
MGNCKTQNILGDWGSLSRRSFYFLAFLAFSDIIFYTFHLERLNILGHVKFDIKFVLIVLLNNLNIICDKLCTPLIPFADHWTWDVQFSAGLCNLIIKCPRVKIMTQQHQRNYRALYFEYFFKTPLRSYGRSHGAVYFNKLTLLLVIVPQWISHNKYRRHIYSSDPTLWPHSQHFVSYHK